MLLLFMLLWSIDVLAEETKAIPNKVGSQIGSEVRGDAVNTVLDNIEELNCKDDPNSWECMQTKRTNAIITIVLIIIAAVGVIGWLCKR